jgi:hypothetical protein
MVVYDLHVFRSLRCPAETNPELVIYANANLALSIAFENFQSISRRRA